MEENTFYSINLEKFAEETMWYKTPQETLADKTSFLVHLMAKIPRGGYEHAVKYFYSEAEFIEALKHAPPGIFVYEKKWLAWNEHFHIVPPLPFPRKYQ